MRPERFFLTVLPDFTPLSNIAPVASGLAIGKALNMTSGTTFTLFSEHKDWKFPRAAFKAVWANWRNNG